MTVSGFRALRKRTQAISFLLVVPLASACGGADVPDDSGGPDPWEGREANELFAEIEQDLVAAEGRQVAFDVRAEGAFSADLAGSLQLLEGNALALEASGTFGGDSASLWLDSTSDRLVGGNRTELFRDTVPAGLREAMVIGLTRMGILHNLARLVSGAPPDRADGTVRSWVEVEDVRWAEAEERSTEGEAPSPSGGLSFDIWVNGQRAGHATVWIDSDGDMVGRYQVVEFPGIEMRVTERYRWGE